MGLIQTGLGIASDILGKCGEDKAKAIVDAISDALPNWLEKTEAFYTILDVAENPKSIQFEETEISYTARSIEAHRKRLQPPVVLEK